MGNDNALIKRGDQGISGLTVAKWGLMGVGAIVVAGWALSLLSWFLPFLIVGGIGYGAYRLLRRKPGSQQALPHHPAASDVGGARDARRDLEEFDRRLAEAESEVHRR